MNDARVHELRGLLPRCLLWDWVRIGSRLVRLLRDHRHESRHDALLDRLLADARASAELRELRAAHVPRPTYPPDLPITARKDDIVAAIRAHPVVVIAGETGSGKTTQIPKMCLEAGLGIAAKIGCTQPRRVAATSISRRIAEELGVGWGREVGCKIRFDDRSGDDTYIKLMTDGMLLAEVQGDPLLTEYDAIIIDEAHERSLNIDFLLGYLKQLLGQRPDLKVLITSATIDTATFSRAFNNAPVIEVSGRMFPVEVQYRPFDADSEERGEFTFIDAAVEEASRAVEGTSWGDVLVFLPGERDIREASDRLEGRLGRGVDVVPLYGRLSAGDQQRVFAETGRRKVVVATNIAETSLTIPGIRHVIDAGLARISRYNARTRTRRLPVEPVSQGSANQRKGRAGRVAEGTCIRLYSEDDFNSRPRHTQPEIQRANLAEVILRMKASRLGEIESFPFIDPPSPAAITGGYQLLQELGALDDQRDLTPLGRDLARLPIDPTLGRMLLQAQAEHASRDLLIIASALSIQDPRERPLDQREAADAAHRRHGDPRSDFLSLLKLWDAVHDEWEVLRTQNQRRKFCKASFLSYTRMREWQDLHAQLTSALSEIEAVRISESSADYEAIHRSILSGLLGHVARREERNVYRAPGNRLVAVFPGSALHDKGEKPQRRQGGPRDARPRGPQPERARQPEWIVAGEVVETSQLFARTVAGIDPLWIVQLAPHLCRVAHRHPHWSPRAGRVLVEEVTTFHGLEVRSRHVAYGNVDPAAATDLFIRSALVEDALEPTPEEDAEQDARGNDTTRLRRQVRAATDHASRPAARHPFLAQNRALRERIDAWRTRVRRSALGDVDERMAAFYARHLAGVSSLDELDRAVREARDPKFLFATEADLTGGADLSYDAEAFPDAVALSGQAAAVRYAYAPGEDHDGVTVRLDVDVVRSVAPAEVEWSVPGLRPELALELLRALPKALRRDLMPFPPKVEEIVRELRPTGASLLHDLAAFLRRRYGVDVQPASWPNAAIPAHLRTRVEVVGPGGKVVAAGRELATLKEQFQATPAAARPPEQSPEWADAARRWERFGLSGWSFGDLPESLLVGHVGGLPVMAWPGLAVEDGGVSVRLFRSATAASESSRAGLHRLVELALQKDFAWMEKDLRGLSRHALLYAPLGPWEDLMESSAAWIRSQALPPEAFRPLRRAAFDEAVEAVRTRLRVAVPPWIAHVGEVLERRREAAQKIGGQAGSVAAAPAAAAPRRVVLNDLSQLGKLAPSNAPRTAPATAAAATAPARPATGLAADLLALVPPRFPERIDALRMPHLPRYLRALAIRAERATLNPAKDAERARVVAPYVQAAARITATPPTTPEGRALAADFQWALEEFRVSTFAQELGTARPVSAKRLDDLLAALRTAG